MTDTEADTFHLMSRPEQRIRLQLEDVNPDRLEFDRWRMANGRDPEWAASDRRDLATTCQCVTCKSNPIPEPEGVTP